MFLTFEREPLHPFYRHRPQRRHHDWDDFVRPALETVNTLNHMLHLANCAELEPGLIRSLASQRAEKAQDKFEIKMDVQQFAPNELDVKVVDNCVLVEGKHEEKQDEHGFISRHFVRRYQLPDDVKAETVTCNLSSDGVLLISALRMIEEKPANERTVPINFTGQPAVKETEKPKEAETAAKKVEGMDVNPSEVTSAA